MINCPMEGAQPPVWAALQIQTLMRRIVDPLAGPRPASMLRPVLLLAWLLVMATFWMSAPAQAGAVACPVSNPIAFAGLDWDSGAFLGDHFT